MNRTTLFRDPVFRSLATFASDLDRACAAPARAMTRIAVPAMNIYSGETSLTIEAEVPGLTLEDIEVVLNGDELTIRGNRASREPEGTSVLRRERPVGTFERTFTLPTEIDSEHASASLEHGVLTISLPKSQAARPRRLAINGASTKPLVSQSEEVNPPDTAETQSGGDPADN
ncbi:MAG: Hsp20/alpha crystallin family protein [Phycisphaerales bacterium JB050]